MSPTDIRVDVPGAINAAFSELSDWLGTLLPWQKSPWIGESRGYRGPTLLGEADCRMHLVRFLARHLPPEWLHQEVPASAYLFPAVNVSRNWRIDIGLIDPARLHPGLTADEMRSVCWNALIEVKFRGNSPGWEFAAASPKDIGTDLEKLSKFAGYCDHAYVAVIEEMPPLTEAEVRALAERAPSIDLRFLRSPVATGLDESRSP